MMNRYVMVALLTLMSGSAFGAARAKKTPQQEFGSLRRAFAKAVRAGNQKEARDLLDQHKKTLEAKTNPTLSARLEKAYKIVFNPTVEDIQTKAIYWEHGYNPLILSHQEAAKRKLVIIREQYESIGAPTAITAEEAQERGKIEVQRQEGRRGGIYIPKKEIAAYLEEEARLAAEEMKKAKE